MGTTKRASKPRSLRAKKTTKKTTTKVAKKAVSKKGSTKKTAKKVATKKVQKKIAPSKLKKKPLKPKAKDTIINRPKTETTVLGFPRSVALSALVIPKLPVDIDTLAIGLARYGGIAIVMLGGLLSYYHASALQLLPNIGNKAEIIGSTHEGTNTTLEKDETKYPSDSDVLHQDSAAGTDGTITNTELRDPEPPVNFDFDQSGYFKDIVGVSIGVPYAHRVDVLLREKNSQQLFTLGSAVKKEAGLWHYRFDTTKFENATYQVKAVVINDFGSYDATSDYYEINNVENTDPNTVPVDDSANTGSQTETSSTETPGANGSTDTTTDTETETDLTDVEATNFEVVLTKPGSREVSGKITLEAKASEMIDRMTFFAANERGNITTLGRGTKISVGVYQLQWESTVLPNAKYYFYAVADQNGVKTQTEKKLIAIKNELTNSTLDAEVVTDPSEIEEFSDTVDAEEGELAPETPAPQFYLLRPQDTLTSLSEVTLQTTVPIEKAELYAQRKDSLTARYITDARMVTDSVWRFRFDSSNSPNGDYKLFVRTWYEGRAYITNEVSVKIFNLQELQAEVETAESREVDQVEEEQQTQDQEIEDKIEEIEAELQQSEPSDGSRYYDSEILTEEEIPELLEVDPEVEERSSTFVEERLIQYREEIDDAFRLLATAIRGNDRTAIDEAKRQIKQLEDRIINSILDDDQAKELVVIIQNRLQRQLVDLTLRTEQTERLVRERVGEEVTRDSDNDGITDYDERTIYKTDPNNADTDKDGFVDGLEVLNGFDPTDSSPEVVVAFESPKTAGAVREDVLEVTSITPVTKDPEQPAPAPAAVISGKGLPNSFVTLFIYSNPVVVTVKTDKDGNWSYTFDKEIEDGEHEIYVGITDNAGRVVAKSEPRTFIKTAEAFTPVDAAEDAVIVGQTEDTSLFTTSALLLIASVSVIAIGVILILLGLHLRTREEKNVESTITPDPSVA